MTISQDMRSRGRHHPCTDKTTPRGGDDLYGTAPSKDSPTRRAYSPTHYGMGRTTPALTLQDLLSRRGPRPGNPGSRSAASRPEKATSDPRAAACSLTVATTPPGEQETMMKDAARPHHTGQLVNHRHANRADMTGTIALRHAMPRHGEQDHDDHDDGHT
jgi:hypothetical protein